MDQWRLLYQQHTRPSFWDYGVVLRAVLSNFQEPNNDSSVDSPCYWDESELHHALTK